MNKEQLIVILQSILFAYDGSNEEEIMKLNLEYDLKLVRIGIGLLDFLQEKIG